MSERAGAACADSEVSSLIGPVSVDLSVPQPRDTRHDLLVTLAVAALAATWAGEWVALASRSRPIAVAALVLYALGFLGLAAMRPSLAVVALVVALPLVTIEVGFGDVEKTVSGDKIAVAVVAGVWLLRRGLRAAPSLVRRPAIRWWLVLLALTTVSALGHGASRGELWGLTGMFLYFAVFALALDLFQRDASACRQVLAAAALTAGAVAGLGLVERLVFPGTPFYFKDGVMAAHYSFGSTIGHTNFLAAYLALVLGPLAGLVCLRAIPRRFSLRPWLVASGAVIGIVLVLARSIGALAGVAVAALVVLAIGLMRTRSRQVRAALAILAILAVAITAGIAAAKLGGNDASITVRAATLRIGLAAVQERPWLGFGTNGFAHESARIERALFGRELVELHPVSQSFSAHDAYMNVAVERGLGALVAFVGLLTAIVISGLRRSARVPDVDRDLLVAGLLAGVVAFAAQAMTENLFSFSKVSTIFWIMAAALVSLTSRDGEAAPMTVKGS
ncbi:MAG: hypothetical protein DMD91_32390 [Candidatus Rokuibacteriota bacterium]|nr:MAG: hypothetical protein DMD91_32390 [Candidatus Rokubacteria bacterium]